MNISLLTGRLTQDPEEMKSGVSLRIAVRREYKSSTTGDYESDFLTLKAFSKTAEFCKAYLKKGCLVEFKSTIKNNNWADPETNKIRYQNDLIVEHVRVLQKAQGHHEVLENSY